MALSHFFILNLYLCYFPAWIFHEVKVCMAKTNCAACVYRLHMEIGNSIWMRTLNIPRKNQYRNARFRKRERERESKSLAPQCDANWILSRIILNVIWLMPASKFLSLKRPLEWNLVFAPVSLLKWKPKRKMVIKCHFRESKLNKVNKSFGAWNGVSFFLLQLWNWLRQREHQW